MRRLGLTAIRAIKVHSLEVDGMSALYTANGGFVTHVVRAPVLILYKMRTRIV